MAHQRRHHLAGGLAESGDAGRRQRLGLGIDEQAGRLEGGVLQQGGGRHHGQRGAHHQHQVGIGDDLAGLPEVGHLLAEPHYIGAQLATLVTDVTQLDAAAGQRIVHAAVHRGACLEDLAVQMEHMAGTGTLMQVVDILGDDADPKALLLQRRQGLVRGVG
ncbi:hypothetical protein AOR10_24540, partial [Vibrio alginolyticus]